jgi:phosphate transport system protein
VFRVTGFGKEAVMGTRSALDYDMKAIRDDIVRLGSLVNQAVGNAIEAFATRDIQKAQDVVNGDDNIDSLHHHLEERIIATLALQQPMATDLRWLIADLLIANELERMGDYAEGIGRTTLRYDKEIPLSIPSLMKDMRSKVSTMIEEVMKAYLAESPDAARDVALRDDALDLLYKKLVGTLVANMGTGELSIEQGTYLMWAAHNMERIGDRVTNICERVVYARTGVVGGLNTEKERKAQP